MNPLLDSYSEEVGLVISSPNRPMWNVEGQLPKGRGLLPEYVSNKCCWQFKRKDTQNLSSVGWPPVCPAARDSGWGQTGSSLPKNRNETYFWASWHTMLTTLRCGLWRVFIGICFCPLVSVNTVKNPSLTWKIWFWWEYHSPPHPKPFRGSWLPTKAKSKSTVMCNCVTMPREEPIALRCQGKGLSSGIRQTSSDRVVWPEGKWP